jgi:hypothetical protein
MVRVGGIVEDDLVQVRQLPSNDFAPCVFEDLVLPVERLREAHTHAQDQREEPHDATLVLVVLEEPLLAATGECAPLQHVGLARHGLIHSLHPVQAKLEAPGEVARSPNECAVLHLVEGVNVRRLHEVLLVQLLILGPR